MSAFKHPPEVWQAAAKAAEKSESAEHGLAKGNKRTLKTHTQGHDTDFIGTTWPVLAEDISKTSHL